MAIEFLFIGWCKETDPKTGSVHDKVWTAFKAGDNYYAGWGKRDKALSFKNHGPASWGGNIPSTLRTVLNKKKRGKSDGSSYKEVDAFQLFSIFPYFEDEVDKQLMFKTLAGKIM